MKVDGLNTRAHNQMLQDRLKDPSGDLQEREKLIEQYEREIWKRHHQIEKKQLCVNWLNRERLMEQHNVLKRSLEHTTSETRELDVNIGESEQQLAIGLIEAVPGSAFGS